MTSETPEPHDVGDLLAVPAGRRQDEDPTTVSAMATHTAAGIGDPEDVSDVAEGEYVDPADLQEDS